MELNGQKSKTWMDKGISYTTLAQSMNIKPDDVSALTAGLDDGYEQGFELGMGMSYDDLDKQWAYDTGAYIGACLAVRFKDG